MPASTMVTVSQKAPALQVRSHKICYRALACGDADVELGSRGEGHGANVRHRANDGVHLARDTCSTRVIGASCVL
jgi:hypothetical protein